MNQVTRGTHNHIEAAIHFVRACGPVGREEIAREILEQATDGTMENCHRLADAAILHGISTGWLTRYDDEDDAFVMAPATAQKQAPRFYNFQTEAGIWVTLDNAIIR